MWGICNGFKVKKLCKENKDKIDKDYDVKKYSCLYDCLKIKYEQCKEFKELIDNSWGKDLVEDAPWDAEYGAIWSKKEQAYVGVNACGRLMMKVREEYGKQGV